MSEEATTTGADNTAAGEGAGAGEAAAAEKTAAASAAAAEGAGAGDGDGGESGEGTAFSQSGEGDGGEGQGGDGDGAGSGDGSGDGDGSGGEGNGEGDGDGNGEGEPSVLQQAIADIEMPDGITFAEADQAAVGEIVSRHNLPKDAVSDMVKFQVEREQNRMAEAKKANDAYVAEMKAEAMKLPKETLAAANRFVKKFGSEGLQKKMADPSFFIGNDVDVLNVLAIAQKAVDGGFVNGDGEGGSEKSAGETLYNT